MGKADAIDWNETIEQSVLSAIEAGSPLRATAEQHDMTSAAIIRRVQASESFAKRYAHAKQIQLEQMAEELLALADQADKDTYNAQRLKVDTRKWLLSKLIPKVYGDVPPQVNVQANLGVQLVHAIPRPDKPALNAPETPIIDAEVS